MKGFTVILPIVILCHTAAAVPLKIGLLIPLTGPRADGGAYVLNAATLAVEGLRADGIETELVVQDTRYQPKEAVSGLHKLMQQSLKFIVSGGGSGEVLAIAPLTEQNKIIVLVPGAQSEEISDAGSFIFRLIHNTSQEPPFFAREVAKRMRGPRLAIFAAQFSATPPYLKRFIPALREAGKEVGLSEDFEVANTDFRSQLLRLKQSGEEDVLLIATAVNQGHILVQARQLGIRAQYFGVGIESPELVRIAGALADGLVYPYSFDLSAAGKGGAAFFQSYKERFGTEPDTVAANTYDALRLLGNCTKNSTEPAAVSKCLYATRDYDGASGRFSINSKGDAEKELFLKTVERGHYVRMDGGS